MTSKKLIKKTLRYFIVTGLCLYIALSALVLSLKYLVLPNVADYKPVLEHSLSQQLGTSVRIRSLRVAWDGWAPELLVSGLEIGAADHRSGLVLDRFYAQLSWQSLWRIQPIFSRVEIDQPHLRLRRDESQRFWLGDISWTLNDSNQNNPAVAWLLRQHQVSIKGARLEWLDEYRQAPALSLSDVNFVMQNEGLHHRFKLSAQAPEDLQGNVNFIADFKHPLLVPNWYDFATWRGEVYVSVSQLESSDWQPWFNQELKDIKFAGNVRLWMTFDKGDWEEATTDFSLIQSQVRLAEDLDILAFKKLKGRVHIEKNQVTRQQIISLKNVFAEPQTFGRFHLNSLKIAIPQKTSPTANYELRFNSLDLAMLAPLAPSVPLPKTVRDTLQKLAPQGHISDANFLWAWDEQQQLRRLNAQAKFEHLTVNALLHNAGHLVAPGIKNVSGTLKSTLTGTTVQLASSNINLSVPGVFSQKNIHFDELKGIVAIRHFSGKPLRIQWQNTYFKKGVSEGKVDGSWTNENSSELGVLSLKGKISQALARDVPPLIPLTVGNGTKQWLDDAFTEGTVNDIRFRLNGDLADFPFGRGKSGEFWVQGNLQNVDLHFSPIDTKPAWPDIKEISGMIVFDRDTIKINPNRGVMAVPGTKPLSLTTAQAIIRDLTHHPILSVQGQVKGDLADFMSYVEISPLNKMTESLLTGVKAKGSANLGLSLTIPLTASRNTQVKAVLDLANNEVVWRPQWPTVIISRGRFLISEHGLAIESLSASLLGQMFYARSSDSLKPLSPIDVRGALDWQQVARFLNNSDLPIAGLTPIVLRIEQSATQAVKVALRADMSKTYISLPAPLKKPKGSMQTLVATVEQDQGQWQMGASLDSVLRARVLLDKTSPSFTKGLSVAWMSELLPLKSGQYVANINTPEVAGILSITEGTGKSRLSAKLQHLNWQKGEATPQVLNASSASFSSEWLDYFERFDVSTDKLQINGQKFGAWSAVAEQQAEGVWVLKSLTARLKGATLEGSGAWSVLSGTQLFIKLNVLDAGLMLNDLGFEQVLDAGNGVLLADLSWPSGLLSFSLSQLSGALQLELASGRFLKTEPGAAKLLGILSLQALPRRLNLDFTDIFKSGFAFDTIRAKALISKGVLRTDSFKMAGPAALVLIAGETNLLHETQQLQVVVMPKVDTSIPSLVYAAMVNPAVGLATFLTQYVLGESLSEILSYELDISGTWQDPLVKKVTK